MDKLDKQLKEIKDKSVLLADEMKNDIYAICEQLDYKQSSVFSYNIDRLNAFIQELNNFKLEK